MEKIVILDANSLIYRFYYALPFFSSHHGLPTNALYGLSNSLIKIINEEKPDYLIACFDSKIKTFRHYKDVQYKAKRPKIDDDLKTQISLAPKILRAFNIIVLEKENYEADDLIGSLVKKIQNKIKIIYSGDLDLLQILDDNVILKFFKKGISQIEVYDKNKFTTEFKILPQQLADFKALVGDISDNIVGIKGIGKKTAIELLLRFGNIEKIILAAEKKILNYSLRDLILTNKDRLILNKELATILTDLNLDFKLEKYQGIDLDKVSKILREFDFFSILKRLNQKDDNSSFSEKIIFSEKLPLFFNRVYCLIEEDFIYLFDGQNFYSKKISLDIFEKILEANEIIVDDLKLFFKKLIDFKKTPLSVNKFFDLKIAFWLTKNIIKVDRSKILSFYLKKFNSNNNFLLFLKLMPKIYEDLRNQINNFNLKNVLILDQEISLILGLMELNKIAIDKRQISLMKKNLKEELNLLKNEIFQIININFNLNSAKELRTIIFEKLKIPHKNIKKTPKGELSVQENELKKIKDYHPVISKIINYREKFKILSSFINNLEKYSCKGEIITNFEITGTITGRITSFFPNLQNFPLEVREVFIPHSKNSIFVSYDYSQIELRILAHLSEDENLINIFYQNLDIHSIIAKLLFKEDNEKTRKLAKIINYGIIYGISARGIVQKTGLDLKTSQELIENYFKIFPRIKKLIDDLINKFKSFGYTETLLGRKRFFAETHEYKINRIAINTPIQGTAADILKLALRDIYIYLQDNNLLDEIKLILTIHDELIFEIKRERLNNVQFKIKQIMENVVPLKVPLVVKIKKGENLRDLR